jgi:Resolvase, N terminal domain
MGRLTLNILLSFAQFEREIISERTRDKLGAARRKGKWIGGIPVLGYDVDPRGGRLIVNDGEARRVQEIFAIAPVLTPSGPPVLTAADTGARTGDDRVGATAIGSSSESTGGSAHAIASRRRQQEQELWRCARAWCPA